MNEAFMAQLTTAIENLPAEYQEGARSLVTRMSETVEGLDDRETSWTPPSLKLLQATSDRSGLPRGAAPGDMFLNSDKLESPLEVIVLSGWVARSKWNENLEDASRDCFSPDAVMGNKYGDCKTCAFSKWDEVNNKSMGCNQNHSFLVITKDLSKLFYIHFHKTAYKNGTAWKNDIKKAGVAIYKNVFSLEVKTSAAHRNIEHLLMTGREATPVELLPFLELLFSQVRDDRKASLVQFHDSVRNRQSQAALAAPAQEEGTTLLTNQASAEVEAEAEAPAGYTL